MKINKSVVKSLVRGVYIVIGAVQTAVHTYLAAGNTLGFNKETYLGVAITAIFPITAVLSRYIDKQDPAFGRVAEELLLPALEKKAKEVAPTAVIPEATK